MTSADDDLTARLVTLAARAPRAPFLGAPGRASMSYGTLAERIAAARATFAALGIVRGDIVACAAVDRLECAAALAILPGACTFAPLQPARDVDAFVDLLQRIAPRAVLVPPRGGEAFAEAARRLGIAEIAMTPDPAGEAGSFDLALLRGAPSLDAPRVDRPGYAYVDVTSGTTGRPKLVPHGHAQLIAQAQAMGERLALTADDVSAHTPAIALALGKRTAYLVPVLNGASIYLLPESDAAGLLDAIRGDRVTYVPATFAVHRELLARTHVSPVASRRLRLLCVASGALGASEMQALERTFGVPVLAAYGATEIGTAALQSPEPGRRMAGNAGAPVGAEVRIVDDAGQPVAPGTVGEIQVRGPQCFDGYLDDPHLTREAFVDGWYRMGDAGTIEPNGEVRVTGRLDEMVNRGGEKIAPALIDAALRTMPGLADGAAFGVPHPRLGAEIVAAVVAQPGVTVTPDAVRAHVRDRLGPRITPRHVWIVDALPRTENGKLRRSALPGVVGFDPSLLAVEAVVPDAAPGSPLEIAITAVWAAVLGLPKVDRDVDFFMAGGDSLRGESLVEQVEAVFGVALPVQALFEDAGTIASMALRIERERAAQPRQDTRAAIPRRASGAPIPRTLREGESVPETPILAVNGQGSRLPFVYLHGDFTGGGFYSRSIAHALGDDQPTLIVHPHGLVEDAIPETIEAMASDRVAALRELLPRGPYVIGGHSIGALVAYEMARQLAAAGESVPVVVLIEAVAPEPGEADDDDGGGVAYYKGDATGDPRVLEARNRTSDAELRYVRAMHRYPGYRYDGHVAVVRAADRRKRSEDDLGWSRLVGSIELHEVPGNHATLITRHVGDLAATIRGAIARATGVQE